MFKIVEKLGGAKSALKVLNRRGVMASAVTYRKWCSRGSMPWRAKFVLALEAHRKNIAWKEADFYPQPKKKGS